VSLKAVCTESGLGTVDTAGTMLNFFFSVYRDLFQLRKLRREWNDTKELRSTEVVWLVKLEQSSRNV